MEPVVRDINSAVALVEAECWSELDTQLDQWHPADIAEFIGQFDDADDQLAIFKRLPEDVQPEVLEELKEKDSISILENLSSLAISNLVEAMHPDDAADVLSNLEEELTEEILQQMPAEESADVRQLLEFEEDTAGGIMTTDYVAMRGNMSVGDAIEKIAYLEEDEPFYYTYVIDGTDRLIGWIGLWELLKNRDRNRKLRELAHTDIVSQPTQTRKNALG